MSQWRGHWLAVGACLALLGGVGWAAYGYALGLPFMFDDFLDLPAGGGRSIAQILTASVDLKYYRPLPFLLWKGLFSLLGTYDPFWFHLFPLSFHLGAAALLFFLARRLMGWLPSLLAGLLFLLYPFSYQVVPVAGALTHPLSAFLILASLIGYDSFRRRTDRGHALARWGWLALSWATGLGAGSAHESGVVVALLVAAWELLGRRMGRWGRLTPWPAAHFGLAGAFFFIWMAIPKEQGPGIAGESLVGNTRLLGQGLVYPLVRALSWPEATWGGDAKDLLPWALVLGLFLLSLAYALGKRWELGLFYFLWFVVAVAPAALTRPTWYVEDGPRLLYLASAGASLAWAGLWEVSWRGRGRTWGGRAVVVTILAYALSQSWGFLEYRRPMYEEGAQLVRQVVAMATPYPDGARLVYINVPAWFAGEGEFPEWHTGITPIPPYIGLERVVYLHTGKRLGVESVAFDGLFQPYRYNYGLHGRPIAYRDLLNLVASADSAFEVKFFPEALVVTGGN